LGTRANAQITTSPPRHHAPIECGRIELPRFQPDHFGFVSRFQFVFEFGSKMGEIVWSEERLIGPQNLHLLDSYL
jgi:hypothetical protein